MNTTPGVLSAPPDPEAFLLGLAYSLILTTWPCPHCGKTGLCACFSDDLVQQPPALEAATSAEGEQATDHCLGGVQS